MSSECELSVLAGFAIVVAAVSAAIVFLTRNIERKPTVTKRLLPLEEQDIAEEDEEPKHQG